jgi:predicted ATPase
MINTLAISNYRSLLNLVIPFGSLNVITGENASGKSNLYKALRLLSETAQGGVINSLAREGGLNSTFWAGPENISDRMRKGEVEIQGGPKQKAARLRLGFTGDDFGTTASRKSGTNCICIGPRNKTRVYLGWEFISPSKFTSRQDGSYNKGAFKSQLGGYFPAHK